MTMSSSPLCDVKGDETWGFAVKSFKLSGRDRWVGRSTLMYLDGIQVDHGRIVCEVGDES